MLIPVFNLKKKKVVIYGKSLPKKSEVHARFFERENIVEMIALDVDKDFALKSIYFINLKIKIK